MLKFDLSSPEKRGIGLRKNSYTVVFDSRWMGTHGIGRFAHEIHRRIKNRSIEILGNDPLSLRGIVGLEIDLYRVNANRKIIFSPGFNPSLFYRKRYVFSIHDLIHLDIAEEKTTFKSLYYRYIVRPAVSDAHRVLTVSEYSRQRILEWSGVSPEQVVVVGNGVESIFSPDGPKHQPGYSYIFYVRNTKPHKNVHRLLEAFARLQLDFPELRLVLSGKPDDDTRHLALHLGIYDRVVFAGRIPEEELPAYYRGAVVVTMPSLYEGFGLPALEGMACGTPVVVSNTTSLPEVVGDAGILVDPYDVEGIAAGLKQALTDLPLRVELRRRGLERAKLFNWDDVAAKVQHELDLAGAK